MASEILMHQRTTGFPYIGLLSSAQIGIRCLSLALHTLSGCMQLFGLSGSPINMDNDIKQHQQQQSYEYLNLWIGISGVLGLKPSDVVHGQLRVMHSY